MKKLYLILITLFAFAACEHNVPIDPNYKTAVGEIELDLRTSDVTSSSCDARIYIDLHGNTLEDLGYLLTTQAWITLSLDDFELGFRYIEDDIDDINDGLEKVESTLTGLSSYKTYYIRAFAVAKNGNIYYSDQQSFTTQSIYSGGGSSGGSSGGGSSSGTQCSICRGTGKCQVCNGTGGYWGACGMCKGSGKCTMCGGTGYR